MPRSNIVRQAHFEDNPLDLEYLRHDKPLHPTRIQPHMKHVPKYLMPRVTGGAPAAVDGELAVARTEGEPSFVPFKKMSSRGRGRGRGGKVSGPGHARKKRSDPLKKFGR